ncbi:hypothetical protein KP79_PYT22222 [Mizuhopecten yessoensis]|uniref:Ig-like domain-containing protein n=1 Tax=Mizuhopecten yessoensis TaxID=6573 RepID=A0A210QRX8_MIZYE|nr:hypothetical protein KP79_PYT22222 [Mizuhopecten yessoensis]
MSIQLPNVGCYVTYEPWTSVLSSSPTSMSTSPVLSLSPHPEATVVKGQPLILTITIMAGTSPASVLQWSTSSTGENTLGSVTLSAIDMCQEGRNISQACWVNETLVRFSVEQPRHDDTIYCVVIVGNWSSRSTLTISTKIYVIEPVESVYLVSLSGDIIGDQLVVKEGENVTLRCETSPSRPQATISWIRDNGDISSSADTLSIVSVGKDLFRTYQNLTIMAERSSGSLNSFISCNAVNNRSSVNSNLLEIIVLSLPTKTTAISMEYISDVDVSLIWNMEPESVYRVSFNILVLPDTGGLTVGPYTQVDGIKSGNAQADIQFSSRITGLQANRAYSVSVTAYNAVGRSPSVSIYIAISSDENGIAYFHVGLSLIVVASLILLMIGIGLAIRLKQGNVSRGSSLCGLPAPCRSPEVKESDPVYEDLDNFSKTDAPAIEKRLRNARKGKEGTKRTAGPVSGIYNSIGSNLDDVNKKENFGNIYDDIPGGSALFTSSGSGSVTAGEGNVSLVVPKTDQEKDLSAKKPKPAVLKKPASRKHRSPVPTPDIVNKDSTSGDMVSITITEVDETEGESEKTDDKPAEDVGSPCEYMDMRVPETEYVDIRRPVEVRAEIS